MDGFQFLEQIRMRRETRDVPVFIFTAKELSAEEIQRLRALSAETVIRKSGVPPADLLAEVRRVIGAPAGVEAGAT